jgi:hypothetical protein
MSIDLEYAIKQDIRNNPVVREVDLDQKREFLRLLAYAVLCVAMLIFAVVPRTRLLTTSYRLEDLRKDLAAEQAAQRKYRLDLAVALAPREIQSRAERELRMVEPSERDVVVIEQVPASAPASRAIVASAR